MGYKEQITANAKAIQDILNGALGIHELPAFVGILQPGDLIAMRIEGTASTVKVTYQDLLVGINSETVIQVPDYATLPAVGVNSIVYITIDTNEIYRWDVLTSDYVSMSQAGLVAPNLEIIFGTGTGVQSSPLITANANGTSGYITCKDEVQTLLRSVMYYNRFEVVSLNAYGALYPDNLRFYNGTSYNTQVRIPGTLTANRINTLPNGDGILVLSVNGNLADVNGNITVAALGDLTYVHSQGAPALVWNVAHNLNKFPSVTVVDAGKAEIAAQVVHTDSNNLVVTINASSTGFVYCN